MNSYETDNTGSEEKSANPELHPPTNLTGFQRDILVVIASLRGEQPNGVAIRTYLDQYHCPEVNHGRLYQNLRKLIEEEYVKKYPLDGRTNLYRLTDTGRLQMKIYWEWIEEHLSNAGLKERVDDP